MLVASQGTFGRTQFGQLMATPAEEAQVPRLTNTVTSLAQQEVQLRTTFAQLIPDLIALQTAGKDIPAELLALMHDYNRAQGSFMEAAKIWLQARNATPASALPDPNSEPIAVPVFEKLPTSGFGWFGAAKVPASAIRIRHGIVGKEISTSLSGYENSSFAGYVIGSQLGVAAIAWAVVVLLGLAVVGATIVLAAKFLQTSDTAAANRAITTQAKTRVEEVKSDNDLYVSTRDACVGNSTDMQVRLQCIEAAKDVLKIAKEGRPTAQKPISPITIGILTVLGVVGVLGTVGGIGYIIYKRRSGSHAPRAAAMRPRGGYSADDDLEF